MDGQNTTIGPEGVPAEAVLREIAPHVDAALYRARNADVAEAGADPAAHYAQSGWRERRDPNAWFSTSYYLRANPDIAAAGLNPLWHFLVQGRREGRRPRPLGASWRDALDRAAAVVWPDVPPPSTAPALAPEDLRRLLAAACAGARGLVVSVGHDRYIEVPGGTQLLIADEQRKFNGDRAAYLNLSPLRSGLGLAPDGPAPLWLNLLLDGAVRGIATAGSVALALAALATGAAASLPRLFVVHALHGHRPEAVAAIAAALRPEYAFFWLHDFGALCPSPRLLRNDIAFCHAPPPDSLACRVCVHGPTRGAHLARIRALFAAVPFHVVAPSAAALDLFARAADLPTQSRRVHPHATLAPGTTALPARDGAVRIALVGVAEYHKGWTRFRDLAEALRGVPGIELCHIASRAELRALDGVTLIAAETTPSKPFGMVQALAAQHIDLVLALSPWPETFGYAAHEALAAGADLLALAGSGHVEALAAATEGSRVLPDFSSLIDFLRDGAVAHVAARRASGRTPPLLRHTGSTATIAFDSAIAATTDAPDVHLLLRGGRLGGAVSGDTWRFELPEAAVDDPRRTVRLRSRHLRGVWDRAAEGERRRLGIAVASLLLDGEDVPAGDPRRLGGWHAAEPRWQWTDGDAALLVGAARCVEVTVRRFARYWRAPLLAPPEDAT